MEAFATRSLASWLQDASAHAVRRVAQPLLDEAIARLAPGSNTPPANTPSSTTNAQGTSGLATSSSSSSRIKEGAGLGNPLAPHSSGCTPMVPVSHEAWLGEPGVTTSSVYNQHCAKIYHSITPLTSGCACVVEDTHVLVAGEQAGT